MYCAGLDDFAFVVIFEIFGTITCMGKKKILEIILFPSSIFVLVLQIFELCFNHDARKKG